MGKFLLSTLLLLTTVFASTAETVTFTLKDYCENSKVIESKTIDGITLSFSKGTHSNSAPTYYTSGDAGRMYIGNTFTVSWEADMNIESIQYTWVEKGKAWGETSPTSVKNITLPETGSNVTFSATTKDNGVRDLTVTYKANKCATPVAMINGEPVANGGKTVVGDELSFSCSTEDATITYTITGGNFTRESQTYDGNPIKLDKIGVYTITAKATKDGLTDSDELKIDDIDVVGKTPLMSFANSSVFGKVGTGVVWQKVIITEPNEENAGAISYSSSDSEVVSVDATTGRIKPEDVKKAGEARIIATMAPNGGDYAEGSAEYLIVVVDPNVPIQPSYTVFDFTAENPYGMTTQTGGSSYEKKIKAISGNNKTVTLNFGGNYRSWKDNNAYFLRMQKSSSIKITVPPGYKITKIGMTGNIDNGSSFTPTNGTISDDTDPDGGKFSAIWVPKDETPISEVTFNAGTSNWSGINKINVMWDAADSELKPVQLTFTPNVNGIYVNEEAEINAVNNPNGRVITYSIPALDPEPGTETSESENQPKKYSIEEIDGKLKVTVTEPGSYTLEARSVGGDGFRDGFAIMRLNVYRHLAVYANEVALEEDVIDTGSGETEVTIDVPENANLYYRFENSTTPETVAENESDDENMLDGYTLYEDGITVPAKTAGTLNFYIANYGYLSPIRKITLSFETGVEEIENAANGVVRIFDLNGREIKGTPEKGVYIRIQNGKATKVVI